MAISCCSFVMGSYEAEDFVQGPMSTLHAKGIARTRSNPVVGLRVAIAGLGPGQRRVCACITASACKRGSHCRAGGLGSAVRQEDLRVSGKPHSAGRQGDRQRW